MIKTIVTPYQSVGRGKTCRDELHIANNILYQVLTQNASVYYSLYNTVRQSYCRGSISDLLFKLFILSIHACLPK